MKRWVGLMSVVCLLAFAGFAIANAAETMKMAKTVTMTGEVVDMGCYMGAGAMGEKHMECGKTCIAAGMPMGLLTSKGMLYLLTPPHDNKDAYNKTKEWVGSKVEVTGTMSARGGMKSLEVASAKAAPAPAAAAAAK
jgi:hypothetical protein